jgi:hypothetical protein
VDLALSTDGGYTYPITLVEDTPNDGSQAIIVPQLNTGLARVRVMCSNNIFFDISNVNFHIQMSDVALLTLTETVLADPVITLASWLTYTITAGNSGPLTANATLTGQFADALIHKTCNGEPLPGDLLTQFILDTDQEMVFICPMQVDPGLKIDLSLEPDRDHAQQGETVNYLVTVSNPNTLVTVEDIMLTAVNLPDCPQDFSEPFSLLPGNQKQFICHAVMGDSPLNSFVFVTGGIWLRASASMSAPEDPRGMISVEDPGPTFRLEKISEAIVFPDFTFYLPVILKTE